MIKGKDRQYYRSPTKEELESPLFEAIWRVIRLWDIERGDGEGYAGANGNDVVAIMDSLMEMADQKVLEENPVTYPFPMKQPNPVYILTEKEKKDDAGTEAE